MENKIEDFIRDDFHKRELKPNSNAFERLEEKMRRNKAAKKRKFMLYFGYAASIVGLIFILQFTIKSRETKTDNTLVTSPSLQDTINSKTPEMEYTPIVLKQEDSVPDSKHQIRTKPQIELVLNDSKKELRPTKNGLNASTFVVDTAANEVLVSFNDTLNKSFIIKEVTDSEIDALLALASKSLNKNTQDSLSISARRMLYEIEVEINKPLPEKVLLTIKTGTNTIKEIVKSNTNENR